MTRDVQARGDELLLEFDTDESAAPPVAVLVLSAEDEQTLRRAADEVQPGLAARRSGEADFDPGSEHRGVPLVARFVHKDVWGPGQRAGALLLSSAGVGTSRDIFLIGVALVAALKRGNNSEVRKLAISDAELINPPLRWVEVMARVPSDRNGELMARLDGVVRTLPTRLGSILLDATTHLDGGRIRQAIRQRVSRRDEITVAADRDRRDRITTSIKIFGLSSARGGPIPDAPDRDELPSSVREANKLWETRMIRADSRNLMPGWARADHGDTWFRFTKGNRRLYLLEAHANVEESQLGGDLIYLRKNPGNWSGVRVGG